MRAGPLCLFFLAAGCATVPPAGGHEAVLAVDEQQRFLVEGSDAAGLERLAHPNLRINAPGGRVLLRANSSWRTCEAEK